MVLYNENCVLASKRLKKSETAPTLTLSPASAWKHTSGESSGGSASATIEAHSPNHFFGQNEMEGLVHLEGDGLSLPLRSLRIHRRRYSRTLWCLLVVQKCQSRS